MILFLDISAKVKKKEKILLKATRISHMQIFDMLQPLPSTTNVPKNVVKLHDK